MDTIRRMFTSCFSGASNQYELVKKDEDCGIEEAQKWIERNPIPTANMRRIELHKISKYVIKIIDSLKKEVPINSSNIVMIKEHLAQIAQKDGALRKYLLDYLPRLDLNRDLDKILSAKIISVCPD